MKLLLSLIIPTFFSLNIYSQIAINNDNSQPDPSSMLDVKSTDSGVLVPRMTSAERNLISNIATGLLVYDTDEKAFMFYDGNGWKKVGDDSDSDPVNEIQTLTMDTKEISISGGNSVAFSPLSKSWDFPQGLDGTVFINFDTTTVYSIPPGKTLYITSYFNWTIDSSGNLVVGSFGTILPDYNNFKLRPYYGGSYPMFPSGTKIKCLCTGVLLDNSSTITPILLFWEENIPNSYTVPPNKKLILKSGFFGTTTIKINGYEVGFDGSPINDVLILPGGTVLSNLTYLFGDRLYTGYLID
ncbi:MAG: hypothetical protein P1U70_17705 [Saprospiraceae bacterium]|nr:hypothetical protein [Saprospiraceae bacterium]